MKKSLLIFSALCVGILGFSQNSASKSDNSGAAVKKIERMIAKPTKLDCSRKYMNDVLPENTGSLAASKPSSQSFKSSTGNRELTFVQIGGSANAYGYFGSTRTYIWADDNIKSVVFSHRMLAGGTYGSSRIAYDFSTQAGASGSWVNNIQVYEPLGPGTPYPIAAGRYPQGGIYNPVGNTDPNNAFYSYFIPTLDGTNNTWGGYGYGVNALNSFNPPQPTQHNVTSGEEYHRLIPNAYTITQDGVSWMIDPNTIYDGATSTFNGDIIVDKGVFNAELNDYEYEESLMPALGYADGINDSKIAFSPDGQTGYICLMSDCASEPQPYTNYHPILYKTTDGGETWNENPIHVLLGGEDGIASIKSFIPDSILIQRFPTGYNREELPYNLGYHCDMVVDINGIPHITGFVALGADDGWYPYYMESGTFHIFSSDGGATWDAKFLYYNKTFEGDFGEIAEYNEPQISSTMDGKYMFISWLDTDLPNNTDNLSPDIYCLSYDLYADAYSEVENVTALTQAMWGAHMGSQSHYVFTKINGNEMICTVPFVYQSYTGIDTDPVNFFYIDGFTYTFTGVGINEIDNTQIKVSQNNPNPVADFTSINVTLNQPSDVAVSVINLAGQILIEIPDRYYETGSHLITIDASKLTSGFYMYTVQAGNEKISKKMIVK
jgi:hypothetical protein